MQDLMEQMQTLRRKLNDAIKEPETRGVEKAKTEAEYRVALANKILEERARGTPVTIMSDICRGDEKIARLRLERDIPMFAVNVQTGQITLNRLKEALGYDYSK